MILHWACNEASTGSRFQVWSTFYLPNSFGERSVESCLPDLAPKLIITLKALITKTKVANIDSPPRMSL